MYVCYMDIDFVFFWYVNNLIFGVYDTKYTMYPYTFGWYHYRCILQVMLPSRHSWIRWSSWSFFLSLKIDQLFSAHFEGFGTHQTRGKSWNPVVFFLVSRNLEAVFTNSAATYARIIIYIHCFTTITPSPRWWKPPSKGPLRPSLSFGFALFDSETFRNFCWMLKSSFVVGSSEGSSFFMCLNLIIPLMVQKSETTTVWMFGCPCK